MIWTRRGAARPKLSTSLRHRRHRRRTMSSNIMISSRRTIFCCLLTSPRGDTAAPPPCRSPILDTKNMLPRFWRCWKALCVAARCVVAIFPGGAIAFLFGLRFLVVLTSAECRPFFCRCWVYFIKNHPQFDQHMSKKCPPKVPSGNATIHWEK